MPFLALPNELILQIAYDLTRCPTCQCRHVCRDISALSRCDLHLHDLLTESVLLLTASPLHMLIWGIVNTCHDTVTLAIELGADPNTHLARDGGIHHAGTQLGNTPIDTAIRMRAHSPDAESHMLKLGTVALLLSARGICTVDNLRKPTEYGDLDLLTLCLPHMQPVDAYQKSGPRVLLELAADYDNVEAVQMMIDFGASVNSTGYFNSPEFLPPLWVCWESSVEVLQVILDAGADPTWRSRHGVSVVEHIRRKAGEEDRVALLVQYGAVAEPPVSPAVPQWATVRWPQREYRGWVPESMGMQVDWPVEWVRARREEGCGCTVCPPEVTGRFSGRAWR